MFLQRSTTQGTQNLGLFQGKEDVQTFMSPHDELWSLSLSFTFSTSCQMLTLCLVSGSSWCSGALQGFGCAGLLATNSVWFREATAWGSAYNPACISWSKPASIIWLRRCSLHVFFWLGWFPTCTHQEMSIRARYWSCFSLPCLCASSTCRLATHLHPSSSFTCCFELINVNAVVSVLLHAGGSLPLLSKNKAILPN